MDFNSLGNGSPFYILRQGDKPVLEVGIVKQKSQPRAKYQAQTPGVFNGLNGVNGINGMQQVVDVVATINGRDETFPEIPVNVEIAQKGNVMFSGSREAMLQAVDGRMQASKKHIDENAYHEAAIPEYEKMMELLNPQYAENRAQAKTIQDLQSHQAAQDKKLDSILELLKRMGSAPKA